MSALPGTAGTPASIVATTCRITVLSAQVRADLAVPVQMTVAELLDTLVSSLGRQVADDGVAHGGWVLQRATEPPLDPGATLAACQIRDGDVLHLRTRATQLPEVAFDDVLDAVATGVATRTARWQRSHTSAAAATVAGALVLLGLAAALTSGPRWAGPAVVLGVGSGLLLLAAGVMARSYGQRGAALTAAASAVAYAGGCGALAVGGAHPLTAFGAPQFLLGACAALLAAVLAMLATGAGLPGLTAAVATALLAAIGTAIDAGTPLGPEGTAALIAALALAVSPAVPLLAFRLSRLPLPGIPADAADLRREQGPIDAGATLRDAARADHYLTGLVGGVATTVAGAALFLAPEDPSAVALALVLAAICLLRARLFTGRGQRAWLLAAGCAAALAVVVNALVDLDARTRLVAVSVPAGVAALVLLGLAGVLPGRRHAPPVGRAADVVEALLVLSVVPLALAVMGVYGALRGVAFG